MKSQKWSSVLTIVILNSDTGASDICELFSKITPMTENPTPFAVTWGHFSQSCGEIEDFSDYRLQRNIRKEFQIFLRKIIVNKNMREEIETFYQWDASKLCFF